MGFFMWKLEPDVWIQNNGDIYESISIYYDSLSISARNTKSFMYAPEKYISSSLREQNQLHFTLGVIYSITVMVLYDFPHTNILTRCSIPIWICLVQIQNYTSLPGPL